MAAASKPVHDRIEDWSELEALLSAPTPVVAPRRRSRFDVTPMAATTVVASIIAAGILAAALSAMPEWACMIRSDCATAARRPASDRTADAVAPTLLQGRSASEQAPAAEPQHRDMR